MHSNLGDHLVILEIGAPQPCYDRPGFDLTVRFSSPYWDGDHSHPIDLRFDGFWVDKRALMEMQNFLSDYVNQPLKELGSTILTGEFDLSNKAGNLSVSFGPRADTIDSRKPVFTSRIKAGYISAEIHFVTDQSCISQFVEELVEILK
jgi:hypothetical protein